MEQNYFFITFSGKSNKSMRKIKTNVIIDITPMDFVINHKKDFYNLVVLNSIPLTKEEYDKYVDDFRMKDDI